MSDHLSTLLDQVRTMMRKKRCSSRTEIAYSNWIAQYTNFSTHVIPSTSAFSPESCPELDERSGQAKRDRNAGIEQFLTSLTVDFTMSDSTQNQALQALLFLYHDLLDIEKIVSHSSPSRPVRETALSAVLLVVMMFR